MTCSALPGRLLDGQGAVIRTDPAASGHRRNRRSPSQHQAGLTYRAPGSQRTGQQFPVWRISSSFGCSPPQTLLVDRIPLGTMWSRQHPGSPLAEARCPVWNSHRCKLILLHPDYRIASGIPLAIGAEVDAYFATTEFYL